MGLDSGSSLKRVKHTLSSTGVSIILLSMSLAQGKRLELYLNWVRQNSSLEGVYSRPKKYLRWQDLSFQIDWENIRVF